MMGGEHPFSTTSVARIGKAVAGALRNADATKNRVLYVHDMVLAQRKAELADMVHQIGEKRIEMSLILGLLKAAVFSGKYPSEYKTVDNELLGLGIMGEEELEAILGAERVLYYCGCGYPPAGVERHDKEARDETKVFLISPKPQMDGLFVFETLGLSASSMDGGNVSSLAVMFCPGR
ncbi:hypothetical protein LV160_008702 [Aspergillus fumigatus]|nr:hypothetical protein LV160_008702 [Aspergillus fumigatus]